MEETSGIAALGIDAKILLVQAINFAILLIVLRMFAFKPLMGILERRRNTIAHGLQAAEEGEKLKTQMLETEREILKGAHEEARAIVAGAKAEAEQARSEAREMLDNELKVAQAEHAEGMKIEFALAKKQLKQELGAVVVAATQKVIQQKIDARWTAQAAREAVEELV